MSLTEAPEAEIPVARMLAELAEQALQAGSIRALTRSRRLRQSGDKYTYQRRSHTRGRARGWWTSPRGLPRTWPTGP